MVKDCAFETVTDNQIRDAILIRCVSDYKRRKILEEGAILNLTRKLEIVAQCESVVKQMAAMSVTAKSTGTVNKLSYKNKQTSKRTNVKNQTCY